MPAAFIYLLWLLLGVSLGWLIAAFRAKSSANPSDARLEKELRQQLAQTQADLSQSQRDLRQAEQNASTAQAQIVAAERLFAEQRNSLADRSRMLEQERNAAVSAHKELENRHSLLQTTHAQLQATEGGLRRDNEELRQSRKEGESVANQLRKQLIETEADRAKWAERSGSLEQALESERKNVETLQQKFLEDFVSVSNKLLIENSARFNQQSGENLERILSPLKENLSDFKNRLEAAQKESSTYTALLKDQIGRIGNEAAALSKALKGDMKVLGNWGENRLDQILEKSGLQKDLHYRRQVSLKSDDGDQRYLDVVVELPDGKNLVIDCKVSLRNYEACVNCATDAAEPLDKFIGDLRKHCKDLGAKRYQDLYGINAPDFVLMYVPIESAYFTALSHHPELFAEALERNVVLITNSTLLATLRTTASVWKLADQQRNALEIAERGGKLYDKFVNFIQDMERIGDNLSSGHKAWEDAFKKLHQGPGNLVWQTEELRKLGAKASKAIPSSVLQQAEAELLRQ